MYLLDTSVVSSAVNPKHLLHTKTRSFLDSSGQNQDRIFVSVITVAETRFGLHLLKYRKPPFSPKFIAEVERRVAGIASTGMVLPVTRHIAETQGRLRADYAAVQMPKKAAAGYGLKGINVELWHDALPPSVLQITENDLWIAATAITHDLTLVAADNDFHKVQKASSDLKILLLS
ncbi:MAG: PIN domain-containing protein [Burkholderiales bacterium]